METEFKSMFDKMTTDLGRMYLAHEDLNLHPVKLDTGKYAEDNWVDSKKHKVVYLAKTPTMDQFSDYAVVNILDKNCEKVLFESQRNICCTCTFKKKTTIHIEVGLDLIKVYFFHKYHDVYIKICSEVGPELICTANSPETNEISKTIVKDYTIEDLINRIHDAYTRFILFQGYNDTAVIEEVFNSFLPILKLVIPKIFIKPWKEYLVHLKEEKEKELKKLDVEYRDLSIAYCTKRAELLSEISKYESKTNVFTSDEEAVKGK
jgi:hypothetical protein